MPRNHLAFRHVRLLPEAVLAVLVLGGDGARVEGAVPGEGPAVPPRYVDNRYLDMKTRYVDIYLSTHQLLILTISRTFSLTTSTCSWLHTDPGAPWLGYRIMHMNDRYETKPPNISYQEHILRLLALPSGWRHKDRQQGTFCPALSCCQ